MPADGVTPYGNPYSTWGALHQTYRPGAKLRPGSRGQLARVIRNGAFILAQLHRDLHKGAIR